MTDFDSAWLKWAWAARYADTLQTDIAEFIGSVDPAELVTSRTEYDATRHCVVLRVDTFQPPPRRWGLRLGDVAHNFRSALDHVAWALVTRGRTPPDVLTAAEQRGVYFPICATNKDFNSMVFPPGNRRSRLPGAHRRDIAIVRRYQPYSRGESKASIQCLTPLARLASADKHREIQPIWSSPDVGGWVNHGAPVDCEITRVPDKARREVIAAGSEIHRIYVRKTGPNPDIHMEAQLAVRPMIEGPFWLDDWLRKTATHIGLMLAEFADPPDDLSDEGLGAG
jgi:hypothetical protein